MWNILIQHGLVPFSFLLLLFVTDQLLSPLSIPSQHSATQSQAIISQELVLSKALTVIILSVQGITEHLCLLVKIWKNLLQCFSPTYILISLYIYKLKQFLVEINLYRDALAKGGKWGQLHSKRLWVCVVKNSEVLKI